MAATAGTGGAGGTITRRRGDIIAARTEHGINSPLVAAGAAGAA
eukprot:SAG31_NODE_35931_length_318_cov_0.712329_1_plen_43_part_01